MMKSFLQIILLLAIAVPCSAQAHKELLKGDKAFRKGDFQQAEFAYRKAKDVSSDYKVNLNLGNSTYYQGNFELALEYYKHAINHSKNDLHTANAYYNLGNTHVQLDDPDKAIEAYISAIKLDRTNENIRTNLLMAQLMKDLQSAQPEQQQQQQQEQQDSQEQQEQEEQDQQEQQESQQDSTQQNQQKEDQQEQEETRQDSTQQQSPQDSLSQDPSMDDRIDSTLLGKQSLDSLEAVQLLEVILEKEQKLQEKMRKFNSNRKKPDKDW